MPPIDLILSGPTLNHSYPFNLNKNSCLFEHSNLISHQDKGLHFKGKPLMQMLPSVVSSSSGSPSSSGSVATRGASER